MSQRSFGQIWLIICLFVAVEPSPASTVPLILILEDLCRRCTAPFNPSSFSPGVPPKAFNEEVTFVYGLILMNLWRSEIIDISSSVFSSNETLLLKQTIELSNTANANILQSCGWEFSLACRPSKSRKMMCMLRSSTKMGAPHSQMPWVPDLCCWRPLWAESCVSTCLLTLNCWQKSQTVSQS